VTVARLRQPEKEFSPIAVTDAGISMQRMPLKANANDEISLRTERVSKRTMARLKHDINAFGESAWTADGITAVEIEREAMSKVDKSDVNNIESRSVNAGLSGGKWMTVR
jgi:hypothetical protein